MQAEEVTRCPAECLSLLALRGEERVGVGDTLPPALHLYQLRASGIEGAQGRAEITARRWRELLAVGT
jgi:hypothetical protein